MVTYRDIGERLTMLLSNGILSSMALSPVSSFRLYIKIGLWILTAQPHLLQGGHHG